jgi:hypothetical protein
VEQLGLERSTLQLDWDAIQLRLDSAHQWRPRRCGIEQQQLVELQFIGLARRLRLDRP